MHIMAPEAGLLRCGDERVQVAIGQGSLLARSISAHVLAQHTRRARAVARHQARSIT